jgi:ADP-ribose pyrophosphatase
MKNSGPGQFGSDDVEIIADETHYSGFYQLRSLTLRHRLFNGGWSETINRELFSRHDAVGVLLVDTTLGKVLLIEQLRVGVIGSDVARREAMSPWLLELVAGLIDCAEAPEAIARREALEEAGIEIEQLEKIGNYYSSPGASNEYFYLFAGKVDLSEAGGVFGLEQEGEDILVHLFDLEALWQLLAQGKITNAHTLITLQWLQLNYGRLQSQWR